MADYNVNMKQWNGSSFDNVLPLAFNSKALEGKSYDDIIQYAQSKNLLLYTGQYTGTGTYGSNNPTTLTFPFEPILWFIPKNPGSGTIQDVLQCFELSSTYYNIPLSSYYNYTRIVGLNTIQWYNTSSANQQLNTPNRIYNYVAIGGYDMGGGN